MWSDNAMSVDCLNVQHLVRTVVDLLDMDHLSPVTIGVYGDWGSGKSSVVLMLKEALAAPEPPASELGSIATFFRPRWSCSPYLLRTGMEVLTSSDW